MKTSSLRRPTLLPLLLLAATACRPDAKPPEPDPTAALKEATVEAKPEVPPFVAIVTSKVNKVIVSEVDARVNSLPVTVGARVKAGDFIARMDDSILKDQLVSAEFQAKAIAGEVGAAGAQAAQARKRLIAERRLQNAGFNSAFAVNEVAASASSAGAQTAAAAGRLAAARNEAAMLRTQLGKTTVTAPIDGVVTRIKLREGQMATKGMPIAYVFDDSDLRIKFMVPAEYRSAVKVGMRISFQVENSDQKVWATINSISPELEPPANVTVAEADIDDKRLAPDQIRVASNGLVRIDDHIQ